ncbi:MAG: hypothetical protein KBG24_10670 [Bacteroidia bacterium]|nr:hypothetical protein [Bacteroidia bacterium]MBP9180947.1 hypothetical protein [Bacteroidia bacterium]MBP9725445.1 hypothetical protein [Bacteroidia bacterium]
MKKQLLLALLLVAGLAAVFAFKQEQTPKKYLTLTFVPKSWITIVDEQGAKQTLELNGKGSISESEKWIEDSQAPLTAQLNELTAKGYKLVAVSQTWIGANGTYTTYIFEKE